MLIGKLVLLKGCLGGNGLGGEFTIFSLSVRWHRKGRRRLSRWWFFENRGKGWHPRRPGGGTVATRMSAGKGGGGLTFFFGPKKNTKIQQPFIAVAESLLVIPERMRARDKDSKMVKNMVKQFSQLTFTVTKAQKNGNLFAMRSRRKNIFEPSFSFVVLVFVLSVCFAQLCAILLGRPFLNHPNVLASDLDVHWVMRGGLP